jgi:hypothetical protein
VLTAGRTHFARTNKIVMCVVYIAKLSSSWQFHLKLSSIISVPVVRPDPTQPDLTQPDPEKYQNRFLQQNL